MHTPTSAVSAPIVPMVGLNIFALAKKEELVIEIWPENFECYRLFRRLETQWSDGVNGRTGLRYEAAYPLMDRLNLESDDWDQLLSDLQTMEFAALEAMHEKR